MLECECCGRMIQDTAEANAYHNMRPHPSDGNGGLCAECVDYANHMVFDSQIHIVADDLNEINRAKFMAMPFSKQCWIILKLHEKGVLSWTIG
jgi:hypothetical protein